MNTPPTRLLDLRDVDFGSAAAETEFAEKPDLLLNGFFDPHDRVGQVRDGTHFLILGRKGSGKSAIAARIRLISKQEPGFNISTRTLSSFPFSQFSEIVSGAETPEVRFAASWEFLLLVALMDSYRTDYRTTSAGVPTHRQILDALGSLGMLPAKDLTALVKQTSTREFKAALPGLVEFGIKSEKERAPDVRALFSTLQEACWRTKPSARHLIFIDGLDEVQTKRSIQYQALASLVIAVDWVNQKLRESKITAKIVLLCRTDLFEQLPGPNKNKVKQDHSIGINWYQDTRDARRTDLAALINRRARAALGVEVDVFETFLPPTVHGQPTVNFLFDHTRHAPRDVIQLFNRIKAQVKGTRATEQEILNALRRYSEDYFRQEIEDEVSRLPDADGAIKTIQAIGMLGKREFAEQELARFVVADARFKGVDFTVALERLFECSAVGNLRSGEGDHDYRFTFKYRNPAAMFNPSDRVLVHRGLLKALNLA